MPDGAFRDGKKWITSPMDVAREIHQGLAKSALIAEVQCVLVSKLIGESELRVFAVRSLW